jgi:hypothetical protein
MGFHRSRPAIASTAKVASTVGRHKPSLLQTPLSLCAVRPDVSVFAQAGSGSTAAVPYS